MPPLGLGALCGSAKQAYVLADCLVACLHVRTDRKATSIGELGSRRVAPVGADSKGGEGREREEEEEEEEEVITSVMPW